MSMLEIKNEKLSEAIKKLRDLYPDDSLGDAIIMAVDRLKKAEEDIKKYAKEAMRAKEKAYEFDKRYCDLLVENRRLKNSLKEKVNPTYPWLHRRPETPENCKVNLEEMEK